MVCKVLIVIQPLNFVEKLVIQFSELGLRHLIHSELREYYETDYYCKTNIINIMYSG